MREPHPRIAKSPRDWRVAPNLVDYEAARAAFSWAAARRELDGLPGACGLNIAHEAVDRHAAGPRAEHLVLRWLGKSGAVQDCTYRDLRALTDRFANVLRGLGAVRRSPRDRRAPRRPLPGRRGAAPPGAVPPVTRGELRDTLLRCLGEVAPEADPARIEPDVGFPDQLGLDSMDLLNFVIALHQALGVDVPEVDYPKLATLDGCVAYLTEAAARRT